MSMNRRLPWFLPARVFLALALAFVPVPALTQESLGIAVVVNDEAITERDLAARLSLVLALSGVADTPESRRQLLPQVTRMLINEKLQIQEGNRQGFGTFRIDRNETYGFVERSLGLGPGELVIFMEERGLSLDSLDDQLTAEIVWGELVRARQRQRPIFEAEVEDEYQRMIAAAHEPHYLLAEIVLSVDDPKEEAGVRENIERLADALRSGGRFSILAQQFSQSASSSNGGDLGWIVHSQLSGELAAIVPNLRVGYLSPPIRTLGGYTLILMREIRPGYRVSDADIEVTIRQAVFAVDEDAAVAVERVSDTVSPLSSCEDLDSLAAADGGPQVSDTVTARLTDLQEDVRRQVEDLAPGTAGTPVASAGEVRVMMVCDRVEHGLPTRGQARNALEARQHDTISRSYLRDLRRQAFVDIRIREAR